MKSMTLERDKLKYVRQYRTGKSCDAICKENNISKSTLYSWIAKYSPEKNNGESVSLMTEVYDLKRRVKKLEDLLEVLRKVDCTPSAPLKEKLIALEPLYGQFSVYTLCDALNVPRGTFYNHMLRNKRENADRVKHRESIM